MSTARNRTGLGKNVNFKDEAGNGGAGLNAANENELEVLKENGDLGDIKAAKVTITDELAGATKAMVGLANVDNTSDADKPVSSATQTALNLKADLSLKGANSGLAELDSNGKVPSSQLPSYVDDVLDYANLAAFPVTGEDAKIYVAEDTNKTYRWSGSAYVEISESLAIGETSSTAHRGDHGKAAYDHTQLTNNPHNVTAEQVGLGNADNTSDANKPVSTATQTALNLKSNKADPEFTGKLTLDSDLELEYDSGNSALDINKDVNITGSMTTSTGQVNGVHLANLYNIVHDNLVPKTVTITTQASGAVATLKAGRVVRDILFKVGSVDVAGITKIDIGTSATPDLYGTVSSGDLTAKNAGILSNSEIVGTLASDVDVTFTVTGTRTAGEVEIIIF